jgi:ABC-2 type transport system permease protein
MPETAKKIAQFLPLTHLVALVRGLWIGGVWNAYMKETAVLAGMLIVCSLVVARTFRWV